jgi:DNA polymerase I
MIMQVIDANYTYDEEGNPIINVFGISPDGENETCHITGFKPYFYASFTKEAKIEVILEKIQAKDTKVELIERFDPIGYQKEKKKMVRIETIDPKQVRELRDEVRSINGIRQVYEADILFKNRFMIDNGIQGMGWVHVDGNKITPIKRLDNAQLRIMGIDIECLPNKGAMPTADTQPIILISCSFLPKYKDDEALVLIGKKSEKEIIEKLREIIKDYNPDIIAGYNTNEFDFPYIEERAKKNKVKMNIGRNGEKWIIKKIVTQTNVSITGRIVIDMLTVLRNSTEEKYKLKQYTLRNVAKELLKLEKLDMDPKEIETIWKEGGKKLEGFIKYSERDAVLIIELIKETGILDKYIAQARASGALLQDIINGGQTGMIESLIIRRFKEKDRVVAMKPDDDEQEERLIGNEKLKGAVVLEPLKGIQENVVVEDFKSLYPTIMMAHNLCYTTVITDEYEGNFIQSPMGGKFVEKEVLEGIIPAILRELLDKRTTAKKAMKLLEKESKEYKLLDAEQYAYKILLNSFYGYSGYARARLYHLDIANAVTSYGRENIERTKNVIHEIDTITVNKQLFMLQVVYGDTDSVMVKILHTDSPPTMEEMKYIGNTIAKEVTKNLPKPMELIFEAIAKRGIFLAKKRYALWRFEESPKGWVDKIKAKGIETVRRDWCNLTKETITKVLEMILKEGKTKEAISEVKMVVDKLNRGEIPIEQLVMTKTYSKGASAYKNIQPHIVLVEKMKKRGKSPQIGDRIPFVVIAGRKKEKFVDRAEDPEYVIKNKLPIDNEYYMKKQLLPPAMRIFETINAKMDSKELEAKDVKQKSLLEF